MTDTITLPLDQLDGIVKGIFARSGLTPLQARTVADVIVAGERDGCKSHGIYRIEGCLKTIADGKVVPDAVPELVDDGSGVIRVSANGAFSNAAFEVGLDTLAARARKLGVAALVINDCTHFSALWPEIEMLTDRGLAGMAMCPSYSAVAPAGGTKPTMGTNPFAFGWPRKDAPPFVFDCATSVAARGEIELHRRAGKPLPEGWAIDSEGHPTTDPEAALDGAMLPFGAHKGSAISIMVELLAAAMIGDMTSPEALDYLGSFAYAPKHGEQILAFDIDHFAKGRPGNPLDRAETLFDAIAGQGARLPSQRRFAARAQSLDKGITLTRAEMDGLEALAAR